MSRQFPSKKKKQAGINIGGDVEDAVIISGHKNIVTVQKQAEPFVTGSAPLPPSLVVGRDDDMQVIKGRLIPRAKTHSMKSPALIVIRGLPGVGKSTLTSKLASDKEVKEQYSDKVLWVPLGLQPDIPSLLGSWGRALGIADLHLAKTVQDASSRLAAVLDGKRMLLIIDDVWEAQHAVPFMVGGPGCATLITTRATDVAQALAGRPENIYHLKVLREEQSLELLSDIVPIIVQEHEAACRELVQELEGLPLALQVAGRLLNAEASYGFGVTELLQDLRSGKRILEAKAPPDRTDLENQTIPTVAVLLQRSTDRLDEVTRDCFAYLGVFAPKPATFNLAAMQAVWEDVKDPKPIVRNLVNRGLLEPIPQLERYQMHALLVAHAKSLLEK